MVSDGRGPLDKGGGEANSGGERVRRTPYRTPEPGRWPVRPPAPEPLLFSEQRQRADREYERLRLRQTVEEARAADERAHGRKMGLIAVVGIAALIGGGYLLTKEDSPRTVTASCVREDRDGKTIVHDSYCGDGSSAVINYRTNSLTPQYRYYYGSTGAIGESPSGGTTVRPRDAEIKTNSGKVIQRGGLGKGGGSSGS